MADHQVLDEIVDATDEVVIQGRVSPSIPLSNRSRDRQRQRESRVRNRGSQGRSANQVLKDAQHKLATIKGRRSERSSSSRSPLSPLSASRTASSTSHREHTERNRSPLAAPQQIRSLIPSVGTNALREQSRSDTDAEVDDPLSDENENEVPVQTSTPRGLKKVVWCGTIVIRLTKLHTATIAQAILP